MNEQLLIKQTLKTVKPESRFRQELVSDLEKPDILAGLKLLT